MTPNPHPDGERLRCHHADPLGSSGFDCSNCGGHIRAQDVAWWAAYPRPEVYCSERCGAEHRRAQASHVIELEHLPGQHRVTCRTHGLVGIVTKEARAGELISAHRGVVGSGTHIR